MGLNQIVEELNVRVSNVPPQIFGHHGKDYMDVYIKQIIIEYEQIKKEKQPRYMKILETIKEVILYG